MAKIRELVESAIAESFDEHLRALHDDVVTRVLRSVAPMIEAANVPARRAEEGSTAGLAKDMNSAIAAIQHASQQVEILKNLLDGAAGFSSRAALFILRGNVAVGWQARGFADNDSIKAVMVDAGSGALGKVIQSYAATKFEISEFDPKFDVAMGAQSNGDCVLVPLVVRGKVAAILYADAGDEGVAVDLAVLELLCRAAGDWIELQALRKAAGAPAHYPIPAQSPQAHTPAAPVPVHQQENSKATAQAPAAVAPAPTQPAVSVQVTPTPTPASVTPPEQKGSSTPEAALAAAASVQQSAPNTMGVPVEHGADEEELHKKARRFAKLLVDEIILYNQKKVSEGRQHHDLYERLKDDIEKSRATYDKRYAQTSVAKNDYFTQAIIAGLADHNPVLLGSSFPR